MTAKNSRHNSIEKKHLLLKSVNKKAMTAFEQGRFQDALNSAVYATKLEPKLIPAWIDATLFSIKLERWEQAIQYANHALALGGNTFRLFDLLSHAHGALKQWEKVREYGLQALNLRDEIYGVAPVLAMPPENPLPPAPGISTRKLNVISFSLFGGDSKYCESAIINALELPHVYPHWTCRFYIDDSVPSIIVQRLQHAGAEVVYVDEKTQRWPGPMWRLKALSDQVLHRVIFRDADSVISLREACAVEQWIISGRNFHALRDSGTHTELLLAGLWGSVQGSLPPLEELIELFKSRPLTSTHFADQFFLREFVWPYARKNILQHDSMFGFLAAEPFPDGPPPSDFHVGSAEGAPFFTLQTSLPEGTKVEWHFDVIDSNNERGSPHRLCSYPATVCNGIVRAHLPARYAKMIGNKCATICISASQFAT